MQRKRLHQTTFILAGIYNILWGIYSSLDPQWLFRFSDLPLLNHPPIFASMAMIVALYGVLYFEVARRPETSFLLGAIGLLGKILGPIGWFTLYLSGEWPLRSIVLILTNDLVWWVPFAIYLWDSKDSYIKDVKSDLL